MINLENFNEDREQFSNLIQKISSRGDLDRLDLFSIDTHIKAKVFLLCYRFLKTSLNLITFKNDDLKKELEDSLKKMSSDYRRISRCIIKYNCGINKSSNDKILYNLLIDNKEIDNLIDVFSIITQKKIFLEVSKVKGFLLEGKSKDEYDKIFKGEDEEKEEFLEKDDSVIEDDIDIIDAIENTADNTENAENKDQY